MAARFRVLVPDAQYDDDGMVERAAAGPDFAFDIHRVRRVADVPDASWRAADALLVWHEVPVDADLIARLDNCRIIMRAGVGYDHIDIEAAGQAGIPACYTPDYGTGEVADHAIALMLALRRGLATHHDNLRRDPAGLFHFGHAPLVARLRGQTLGIVGLGRIGTATALRAKGFGLRVIAYDPYLPEGQEIALGVTRYNSLARLLGDADIVSLHAPLTDETHGMIDAAALARMKPGAILINTARGAIVDLDALHAALSSGTLGGAGIDVFPEEPPPPDHPLIAAYAGQAEAFAGRLILTPHAAWYSAESRNDARRLSTERLATYLTTGRLVCCVNEAFLGTPRPL